MVLFRAVADDQLRCELLVTGFRWRRELERLRKSPFHSKSPENIFLCSLKRVDA